MTATLPTEDEVRAYATTLSNAGHWAPRRVELGTAREAARA